MSKKHENVISTREIMHVFFFFEEWFFFHVMYADSKNICTRKKQNDTKKIYKEKYPKNMIKHENGFVILFLVLFKFCHALNTQLLQLICTGLGSIANFSHHQPLLLLCC